MLIGYNTNIRYRGKTYHVQTEDCGPSNPQVVSLLYYQGAILSSKKINYSHLLGQPNFEERLRDLMKQQHREMIMELKRIEGGEIENNPGPVNELGALKKEDSDTLNETQGFGDREGENSYSAKDQKKGLDEILIDFITRRGRK